MFETLPTDLKGWAGWVGMAIVTAFVYLPKVWGERRGDNREIERLIAALAEERSLRKEAEQQLDEANKQINALIREFSDIKASNAQMELQIKILQEQVELLRAELKESRQ